MTTDENGNDPTETSESPPTQTQEHTPSPGAAGIPKRIGQYRIKRAIASGGMGTVYEALQEKPRRTVALKLMKRIEELEAEVSHLTEAVEILRRQDPRPGQRQGQGAASRA